MLASCTFGGLSQGTEGEGGGTGQDGSTTQGLADDDGGPGGTGPSSVTDGDATDTTATATGSTSDEATTGSDDAASTGSDDGEPSDWQSKRHITFTAAARAIDEESFVPVLVFLDDTTIEYAIAAADGTDLR